MTNQCNHQCPMFNTELATTLVKSIQEAAKEVATLNREVGEVKVQVAGISKLLLPNGGPGFIRETQNKLAELENCQTTCQIGTVVKELEAIKIQRAEESGGKKAITTRQLQWAQLIGVIAAIIGAGVALFKVWH